MNNTEGDPQLSYTTSETGVLDRVALFEQNLEWARAIARNVHRKLPPSFDIEDLEQIAVIAMWKLCEKYDPDNAKGTPFQGFAYLGVRGAVLMNCRRRNWREATHESLSSSYEAQPAQVLNIKGEGDPVVERWSIGRTDTKTRTAVDQRPSPEQALQAQQEEAIERGRLEFLFSAIEPPVPEGIVLLRTAVLGGVDLDELARERRVSIQELTKALNRGVRQLREIHRSAPLKRFEFAARPILRNPFRNGIPVRLLSREKTACQL